MFLWLHPHFTALVAVVIPVDLKESGPAVPVRSMNSFFPVLLMPADWLNAMEVFIP